jgi:hypothetical protein
MLRSLEDGGDVGLLFLNDASANNRLKRPVIAMNARWEPERDPMAVVSTLRCSYFERTCSESPE